MTELPVEIWLKICRLACTDDGAIGRALSAVSRHVRVATTGYHYRVVSVNGSRQALKLFKVQQNSLNARRIRHLYLGDLRDYASGLSISAMPRRAEEVAAMHGILEFASNTLQTLTIVSCTTRQTFTVDHIFLDDLYFPHLSELTLRGCYSLPLKAKFAPNLTRLHITSDVLYGPFARLMPKFYPKLTHLRISRLEYSSHLEDILEALCGAMGLPCPKDATLEDEIPAPPITTNRFILVEPGPGHWIGPGGRTTLASPTEWALLRRILSDRIDRLTVLPQSPGHSRATEAIYAKADWLDRINDGLGCWVSLNSEKAVRRCLYSELSG